MESSVKRRYAERKCLRTISLDTSLPPDFVPSNSWKKQIEVTGVSVSIRTTNLTVVLGVSLHYIPKVISIPSDICQTPALSPTWAPRISRDQSQTGSRPSWRLGFGGERDVDRIVTLVCVRLPTLTKFMKAKFHRQGHESRQQHPRLICQERALQNAS